MGRLATGQNLRLTCRSALRLQSSGTWGHVVWQIFRFSEDGGRKFLRNFGNDLQEYTVWHNNLHCGYLTQYKTKAPQIFEVLITWRTELVSLAVTFWSCILWGVLGSHHGRNIGYPDWGSRCSYQFLMTNAGIVPLLVHDRFLPYPFQFIIHQPS
jgi:hypothetical protein